MSASQQAMTTSHAKRLQRRIAHRPSRTRPPSSNDVTCSGDWHSFDSRQKTHTMPSATTNPERVAAGRSGVLLVILGGVLSLVAAAWWIGGPVIPAGTLKALRGATKSEVRQILGKPSEVMPYGDWIY